MSCEPHLERTEVAGNVVPSDAASDHSKPLAGVPALTMDNNHL